MVLATAGPGPNPDSITNDDVDWSSFALPEDTKHNVAKGERVGSVALGAALVGLGLRRRDSLGAVAALFGGYFIARGATGHCFVYQALGVSTGSADAVLAPWHRDDVTGRAATVNARKAILVERSVRIDRPREQLFAFWRDFENLPRFMEHLVSVRVDSPTRSHWAAKGPAGRTVEWDAEIVNEVPNEIIAWKSIRDADVANAGAVNFSDAPDGRGTIVRVRLDYEPPGGRFGAMLTHFTDEEPDRQIDEDLQKLKRLMESGVIRSPASRAEGLANSGGMPQE
jgi:uncharacterized membrane protein